MSARSPFRSHLLQQWTNSRRSPIVVQQWLQQEIIHEEEDENRSSAPSSLHSQQISRRSFHNSTRRQGSLDLSSVDTSPSIPSVAFPATPWASSGKSVENRIDNGLLLSGGLPRNTSKGYNSDRKVVKSGDALLGTVMSRNTAMSKHGMPYKSPSSNETIFDSLGKTIGSSANFNSEERTSLRLYEIEKAIHRAVKLSKTTQLYKDRRAQSTEGKPFTFRKLLSFSRSGKKLLDICFEVTLRATGDDALAREEQKSWSEVPAFLVAIVHDNQAETAVEGEEDLYKVLGYSPPTTEDQLEDYASACAAVQTAIHSLADDGLEAEWITSGVVKTPAFRSLVKAKPTDRIAALIKVHDVSGYNHLSRQQI